MRSTAFSLLLVAVALAACTRRDEGTGTGTDVAKIKALHRGELSAIDSYDDAMKKLPDVKIVDFTKLRADHVDAADKLRARIVALGATPDASAGPWGDWAEAVTKSAAAFGEDAALRALQTGETHGKNEYEEALKNDRVDAETKRLIRDVLLPRQQEHVDLLKRAVKTN